MRVLKNQFDFTHGELAPQMISRVDLEVYGKGAQRLRNVAVIPQGGARRRFGTEYIANIVSDTDKYMGVEFAYSETISYALIFTHHNIAVYYNDVFQTNIATTYDGEILENLEVKYTQQANSLVIVHPDYAPAQLSRGADHVTWTLANITFQYLPAVDFNDVSYTGETFTLSAVTVSQSRTLTCSGAIFTDAYVGGLFIGIGPNLSDHEGVARITAYVSPTQLTVSIISDFDTEFLSGGMTGEDCFLGKPAWGATKGYPSSATFYEGRLYFGGTKSLPQTLFGSVVNDVFNFDEGDSSDDDAFQITILSDRINTIKHLVSDRTLQIFTNSGEFAAVELEGKPLTPSNISIKKQTNNGANQVRPFVIDNQTLYINYGGNRVYSFAYDQTQEAYNSTNVSLLSPHLIVTPVDGCISKDSVDNDFEFLFIVNSDGTLAIYQSLKEQNVSAWTLSETVNDTVGKFKRVFSVGNSIYFIIERIINGSIVQYVEKLNWDYYTDCTVDQTFGAATSTITGLTALIGQAVRVIGDDYVYGSYTVDASGEVELVDEANNPITVTHAVVGLPYTPLITPMPLSMEAQNGDTTYIKKQIFRAYIDYFESVGIKIIAPGQTEGILIPFRDIGDTFPYPAPTPQTGFYEYDLVSTWEARQMLTITQEDPLPMTILAIGFMLEV